jgi:hypothetical protein
MEHELLDLPTFHELVNAVYRAVNARTEHALEGWHQCKFTVPLWRPSESSSTWFSQEELPEDPEERRFLLRRINANRDLLTKVDRMSPAEALALEQAREREVITRLPDNLVGLLLPREWANVVKVGPNHCFTLPNPLWPDSRDTYVASWDDRGAQVTLDIGKRLLGFHNPFHDGRVHLHDENGAYVTTLWPQVKAEPFSPEKTLAQLQTRGAIKAGHEAHLRARLADIGKTRVQQREINRELLALTREERKRGHQRQSDAEAAYDAALNASAADYVAPAKPAAAGPVDPYASLPD